MRNFIMILTMLATNSYATACVEFFLNADEREGREGTLDLLAYWGTLLEQQIMGEEELQRVRNGLENGVLVNPFTEEKSKVNSAALLHRAEIQKYLDSSEFDHEKILQWAIHKLHEKFRVKIQRADTQTKTESPHQEMEFFPIPPGEFEIGDSVNKYTVKVTQAFLMMTTPVTQRQWQELMGENPSSFKGLDHPVDNITFWSAMVFANRLSEKHGLKPMYNFKGILFSGQAEDGSYQPAREGAIVPMANSDLTEGFRLPLTSEQEYVRKNLGQAKGRFFFGDNTNDLEAYAWYEKNSNGTIHPVGELKPWVFNGKKFFDLYGNVWEWGVALRSRHPMLWGGSFACHPPQCYASHSRQSKSETRGPGIGFRLVRTLP